MLEKVQNCDNINAEDIREQMANDKVCEITDNDIVKVVTQGGVMEEK